MRTVALSFIGYTDQPLPLLLDARFDNAVEDDEEPPRCFWFVRTWK